MKLQPNLSRIKPQHLTLTSLVIKGLVLGSLIWLFTLNSPLALALPEDRQLPIQVTAHSMSWNNQQQLAKYQGEVTVNQGQLRLEASQLHIQRTAQGELQQILASTPKGQAYMRDLPTAQKPEVEAWGETIDYLPLDNLVILTGTAKLIQGADTFSGHKLTYNLVTQDIQAEQPASGTSKVEVILAPNSKDN